MAEKQNYIHSHFKNADAEKRKRDFNQKWVLYISQNIENESSIYRVLRDERGH